MPVAKHILLAWIFGTFSTFVSGQSLNTVGNSTTDSTCVGTVRIMFYNVENLFDTFDDPATEDEEFTPGGEKKWTEYRYRNKLNNIAKTILAAGGWEPPDIIGLCEVENFSVLQDLTSKTMLKAYNYQIIHENSKDLRGIDNALLIRAEKVKRLAVKSIIIPLDDGSFTRDILYSELLLPHDDTIHFFVNHWPSRYGGKEFSESKRIAAAQTLKIFTNSLFQINPEAKIFIMGDFNDEASDKSLSVILGAESDTKNPESRSIYNLSYADFRKGKGTLVYKEINYTWFLFDQIIVSGAMLAGHGFVCADTKSNIFTAEWLLKTGRPFRTYQGPIYKGGFSDHLPIFIDLCYKE